MNHCTIYLNDGKTLLDLWPRDFDRMPEIGDFVTIDCDNAGFLNKFKKLAMVCRIEEDPGNRTRIYLKAEPAKNPARRMVVLLNASFVPEAARQEVERHLRRTLGLPDFEWTRSENSCAVLEIRSARTVPGEQIRSLCTEVRQIMEDTVLPA